MLELNLDQVKQIEIEILSCFDKFCRENKLRYSLAYGSLIGAIRHKGFIPWDDDVDVWMPRPDYNFFVETFVNERFKLLCYEKCDYWQEFGKLTDITTTAQPTYNKGMGIFIDVFPVDGLPLFPDEYKKSLLKQYQKFSKMRAVNVWKKGKGIRNIPYIILGLFQSTKELFHKFEKEKQKYPFQNSTLSWDLYTQFETADFDDVIDVEFEGMRFCALANYDKYLRAFYGDYMQYPPVEKRVSGHNYQFFLKNISH